MFQYEKKLQYPVKIARPNPRLAAIIISQYGGPDGELGASLRYLSQRYSMPFDELKGLLTDIGIEDKFWLSIYNKFSTGVFVHSCLFLVVVLPPDPPLLSGDFSPEPPHIAYIRCNSFRRCVDAFLFM